jgi:formylglycine-generating enzyme required for sulfatase activity
LSQGFIYSGSSILSHVGWDSYNSRGSPVPLDILNGRGTWPVGQKAANELGIHDMTGNVWEWCLEPVGATSRRRVRGGGYATTDLPEWPNYSGVAYLDDAWAHVDSREKWFGFRLARNSGN